jgi:glycosyltransferase involved in cell wall biosynthesis
MSSAMRPEAYSLSIVVPFYNEIDTVRPFLKRPLGALEPLTENFEIVCVDDGSVDETYALSVC